MLQIKQIARYDLPRYPKHGQYVYPPSTAGARVRDVAALLALAALIESCMWHTAGIPPPVKYFSELEARKAIEGAFSARGIRLQADRTVVLPTADSDSLVLTIDGFNDSLQVGYEYVVDQDWSVFTSDVCHLLDSVNRTATPHIAAFQAQSPAEDSDKYLRRVAEAFLDSLKVQGVI
jgi:hypothetical protein